MTIPSQGPPDRISPEEGITQGRPTQSKPQGDFESMMGGTKGAPNMPQQTQGTSPVEMAQGPKAPQGAPSIDTLVSQVGTMQDSMSQVKTQLQTKNLQLNRAQAHLLNNKFTDTSTYLRAANGKMGLEAPPMPTAPTEGGPVAKFLAFVTDGENQLSQAKQQLTDMKNKGDKINPTDMMLIQIKMNQAQQEIEYSTTLLGKVVSSLSQIMQTQV